MAPYLQEPDIHLSPANLFKMSSLFCCGQLMVLLPFLVLTKTSSRIILCLWSRSRTPKALKKKTTSKIQPKITDVFKSAGKEASVSKGMLTFNFPVVESIIMNLMCVHVFFSQRNPQLLLKIKGQLLMHSYKLCEIISLPSVFLARILLFFLSSSSDLQNQL